jgi:hypothetical protein
MAKNKTSYFESRPDIVKIFEDLEKFHDYCRFEMVEFNEANLYNRDSQIWNNYYFSNRPRKPRGEFNRSGNRNNYSRDSEK